MNEELFNEASKSNILSKQLVDQLQESMTYSSISFINWTIEVLKLLKARIERGDKIKDETTGVIYDLYTFRQFVENNFSTYITGQSSTPPSDPRKSTSPWKPAQAAITSSWQTPATKKPTAGSPA